MTQSSKIPAQRLYSLIEDLTTTELNTNKTLSPDGENGVEWVDSIKYTKQQNFFENPSDNFNSSTPTDIPDMKITISENGDYVLFCITNCNGDQNEELDLYIALTPITNRVVYGVPVLAGEQLTLVSQVIAIRLQKNQDQSIQGTFVLDELEVGDIVDFQLDTRGDNVDLTNRRFLAQSWG